MNIVILGATGGIGSCLAENLSSNNNLFIGSRDLNKVNSLIEKINTSSDLNISGTQLDASKFDSVKDFLDSANNYLGSIDCIINCVDSLLLKPAHTTLEEELDQVYRTNVFSAFGVIKFGFKYLRKNGGSIIWFSSAASMVGLKNHEAIASAKAAISSLVLSASSTYSRYNIRINAIAPGLVETPLTESITNNKMSLDYSKNLHGLNRIGKPDNFVPMVTSLIDPKSDWITGQTIAIDGGLSNVK